MHGSFSRADTRNIMGAAGPDFRQHFDDSAPASNADIGKTIAEILGLRIPNKGKLVGRVLSEAMPNGAMPHAVSGVVRSVPDALGMSPRWPPRLSVQPLFRHCGLSRPHPRAPCPTIDTTRGDPSGYGPMCPMPTCNETKAVPDVSLP